METANCPVCVHNGVSQGPADQFSCGRCGEFTLGDSAARSLARWTLDQRINLSGWIRENPKCKLYGPELLDLQNLSNLTVGEKAGKILQRMASKIPKPGFEFKLGSANDLTLELMGIGRVIDSEDFYFVCHNYLYEEMHFLLHRELRGDTPLYTISPKGWAYIESLRHGNPTSQIAFIAMWFDKSQDPTHAAIAAAISAAGYEPLRIDGRQHNNRIDDEIIAAIRRSKFLVADFTGQRGGVYFEAGFARGLSLPVIWLCRDDELKNVHFDTRQYNFIVWHQDKLPDLMTALQNRIEATIGRGNR